MPCPNGVNIPRVFELFSLGKLHDDMDAMRREYARMPVESLADACQECRECGEKCPQSIPISEWMPKVHEALSARR